MENNNFNQNPEQQTGENQEFGNSQQQQHNQPPPQYNQQQQQAPYNNYQNTNQAEILAKVPNSVGALTLGILSIITICTCGPFLSPILSVIALFLVPKGKKAYMANPNMYKKSSLGNLKAGQICAIISLVITISWLILLAFVAYSNPNDLTEITREINRELGF